ncbi:MAG TPA: hypothetical protein VKX16_10320 [Chloroflexota bacterium]|nr:hypothetical protein [Chloroflexota bacterium]
MAVTEQQGQTSGGPYGAEIGPRGFQQDMFQIDIIAGSVHDRSASPAVFTGGDTEQGLGGQAEPMSPGGVDVVDAPGAAYQRIGF